MATGTHEAATPDDEPMDDEHRKILRRCREAFEKDMDPVQVLRNMVDPHLFSTEEEIKIKGNGLTREEQCENLLEILPRKGAKAYKTFKKTIAKVHPHLETTILKAEKRELKSELRNEREKSAGLQRRLSPVKRGQPTNNKLEELGSAIASGWETLGRRLGLDEPTIEEIDHRYVKLPEKGYQMLLRWKQSKGSAATYQALCDALQHELVKRQDLAEKFCYAKEREFEELQIDLDRARTHSARTRHIVRDMTTGSGKKLETLEENIKIMHELLREKADNKAIETRLQEIETSVKQLKDFQKSMKNSVKDEEEEEIELGKQRDQRGDRELMQEERKLKSFETSSECNYNSVLHETSSGENELAVDITPNALELDYSHVSLDRQKKARFHDRATSPVQLESEGKPICLRCSVLEGKFVKLKWTMDDEIKKKDDQINRIKKGNVQAVDEIRTKMEEIRSLQKDKEDLSRQVVSISKKYEEVKDEYDKLVEEASIDSTGKNRLAEEVNKTQTICGPQMQPIESGIFQGRVLLPQGEDFQSPGAIRTVKKEAPRNVVATRSTEGPGKANDVLNHKLSKDDLDCGTLELRDSWWCVDLGENHLLIPTHYSLRHGKKGTRDAILRSWELEGSIDGKNWNKIGTSRKRLEREFENSYFTDTWLVEGDVGAFRFFQIVQTGKHSSNGFGIYLLAMEFYGILLKV